MTKQSRALRRRLLVAALAVGALTVGALGGAAPDASGDQTVRFDDAGDGAPHVSLIGDSTLTGVRWYADYGALRRFNFVLSAESCRRTIEQSCISREGYRSQNVVAAMATLDGELGDVLTVMSGYNDPLWTIDEAIEGVVDGARAQGVEHVVWLTLRTSSDVDYSDPQEQSSINTFRAYNEQLVEAAAASDDYLQVADWATYSNGASRWFEADGVHLTPAGVDALTTFLAGTIERVLAGENVSPAAAPWTVLVPGAEGEIVTAVQQALIDAGTDVHGGADGVFGNDTMAAVAEYQRRHGLQVTGAVDLLTARHLGVFTDGDETEGVTGDADEPADEAVRPGAAVSPADGYEASGEAPSPASPDAASSGPPVWLIATATAATVVALLGVAVFARRRVVVARRRQRRWARTHPSTSPHRSVADLRRAGEHPGRRPDDEPVGALSGRHPAAARGRDDELTR